MAEQPWASANTQSVGCNRRTFLKSFVLATPFGQPVSRPTVQSPDPYPPGFDADDVDATRALAQHIRSVIGSTSVHTTLSYLATANGGASVRRVEAWTDFQRQEQLVDAKAVYTTGQRYVANGDVYTKTAASYSDTVRYDRDSGNILVDRSTGTDVLERFLRAPDFELTATTVKQGQYLFTYEATNLDTESFTIILRRPETVRTFTASLTVDEQGRITSFTFDLDSWGDDGNLLTVETILELDGFNRTPVPQPEWVETEFQ